MSGKLAPSDHENAMIEDALRAVVDGRSEVDVIQHACLATNPLALISDCTEGIRSPVVACQ